MNRLIKFRAWNTQHECFEADERFDCDFDEGSYVLVNHVYPYKNGFKDIYVFEQFTGLTDKNGKEIYEGDILCSDNYNTWDWRGVVKFSHGVFGVEWLVTIKDRSMVGSWGQKHNLRKLDDDILERKIIIGNIHENPELLNK